MIITTKLNSDQFRMINNLMMNCATKQEMFDYLFCKVGINAFHSIHMSNSFNKTRQYSFTVLPIYYFEASKATGMKQDRYGKFYK